jgi:hypothetical protein
MGGACSTDRKDEKLILFFFSESLKGRDNLGDLSVQGRILLKWILRKWGIDWRDLVNTEINFRIPLETGNFLAS